MKYKVAHTTKYAYAEAVPVCHNLVHLAPRCLPYQTCQDFRLLIHPEPLDLNHRQDYFGNSVSYFSIEQAHRGLTATATCQVEVLPRPVVAPSETPPWEVIAHQLRTDRSPDALDAYQFVFSSPRVTPFVALKNYADASFAAGRPLLDAVLDLTARIHEDFAYDPQATTIQTPLEEVLKERHGVCQDFAHLQIACVRAMGLAARYVSGYLRTEPPPGKPRLVGADASHAWLSVYCGQAGWVDLDPTNNVVASTDHIVVAWGRDYSDACPVQGVIVGGGEHRMHISVDVSPDEAPPPPIDSSPVGFYPNA